MKTFLKNNRFILCMLGGIIAGCLVGAFAPAFGKKIEFLGTVFINLMFCVVVPMVFCSISSAIANMKSARRAGKIMGVTIATFLATAAIAGVLMYVICRVFPLVDGQYTLTEGNTLAETVCYQGQLMGESQIAYGYYDFSAGEGCFRIVQKPLSSYAYQKESPHVTDAQDTMSLEEYQEALNQIGTDGAVG